MLSFLLTIPLNVYGQWEDAWEDYPIVTDQSSNDLWLQSQLSKSDSWKEDTYYLVGKNWEPNGIGITRYFASTIEYSNLQEEVVEKDGDRYYVHRFVVNSETKTDGLEEKEPIYGQAPWLVGEEVERTIDNVQYTFTCIDDNYGLEGNALFWCNQIIPATYQSDYLYEKLEDGSYGYAFYPGPLVNFGESNAYKDSNVHEWLELMSADDAELEVVDIGINHSYLGTSESGLLSTYIGSQNLMAKLFVPSVQEAITYSEYLWPVEGSEKAYWLRNPMGNSTDYASTNQVYTVDLLEKQIRPQEIKPSVADVDEELMVTSSVGVRLAFVLPQR